PSNGPPTKLLRTRPDARCAPAGVNGGIFPSGGSTTDQGRLRFVRSRFCSHQSSGPRTLPPGSAASIRWVARRRISEISAGVRSLARLPSNSAGRSSGVAYSLLLSYVPCRSGSPHVVRGGVHGTASRSTAPRIAEMQACSIPYRSYVGINVRGCASENDG